MINVSEELLKQIEQWEKILENKKPDVRYFKCSFVTKKWLEVYVKPTDVDNRTNIYRGTPIYEDNRFKMGKLRAYLDNGTVKDFAIEAPLSMRVFPTWNYSDEEMFFRRNIIFTA